MGRRRRCIAAVLVLLLLAVAWLLWIGPELQTRRRTANESAVWRFRGQFRGWQQDFYTKDLDNNGVHDFWTGDIAGMHQFGVIDRAVAEADARPLVPLVPKPIPWNGYYFIALEMDDSEMPPTSYAQITDGKSGKVHHRSKFGFCAFPAEPGVRGSYIFLINEMGATLSCPVTVQPVPKNWPKDADLIKYWANDCGG